MTRTPVAEAFVHLAGKLSSAIRKRDRIAAQGGDIVSAIGDVQEVEVEASQCFTLVKSPAGMGARR